MSLTVTPGVGILKLSWSLPSGSYGALVKWRAQNTSSWHQVVPGYATMTTISNLAAVPIEVQVVLLPSGGILTATATPLGVAKCAFGFNNLSTRNYVNGLVSLFKNAGITNDRLDIGDGSDFTSVDLSLSLGLKPLVLYNPGTGPSGGLNNKTPAQCASDVVAIAAKLKTRGLALLEFGNEPDLNSDSAQSYAGKYAAAHAAIAGQGITLIAAVTGDWQSSPNVWSQDGAGHGWIRDFASALPAPGISQVDAWAAHPYPPSSGGVTVVDNGDTGWPAVSHYHDIAVSLGSNKPWYITEVGMRFDQYGATGQADGIGQMLNDLFAFDSAVSGTPFSWIAGLWIYSSTDDGAGQWGVLTIDETGGWHVSGTRPVWTTITNWVSANRGKLA